MWVYVRGEKEIGDRAFVLWAFTLFLTSFVDTFFPTRSLKFINICVTWCASFSPYSHTHIHTCREKLISISAPTALMCYLLFTQDWLLLLGIVISVHLLVSHLHFYVPLLYHKEWELTHKKRELFFWHRRCFKMVYGLLFSHCIEMDSLLSPEN